MPSSLEGIRFEDDIRQFLDKIGFDDVPGWGTNRETFELGGQEIDAFARLDDLYLVIDAKTATSLRSRGGGIQNQLRIINGYKNSVVDAIREQYAPSHGYWKCVFILWTKNKKIRERHLNLARQAGIALRDEFDLRNYSQALRILENNKIVRNCFLKDAALQLRTNAFREGSPIEVEAIRTRVGNKKFYTFLIQVKHLLQLAYIFRVETNNILASYQRLLNSRKISRIRSYLRRGGFFANNILVAADEELELENEDNARFIMTGRLNLPDKPCYLEILDGQHRLLAYSNLSNALKDQCLSVTVISNLTPIERARLFVLVNREQTKVPKYLLWDLYTLIEPNRLRGKISRFVQRLNENGPLRDLIRLPRVRSPKAYLSFTNLCECLYNRTGLYRRHGENSSFFDVAKAFFSVVREDEFLGEDWERSVNSRSRKGFICTNNALAIQIYLLSRILRKRERDGLHLPTAEGINEWKGYLTERMIDPFRRYLEDNVDPANTEDPFGILRKQTSNEAQRTEATNTIFSAMSF